VRAVAALGAGRREDVFRNKREAVEIRDPMFALLAMHWPALASVRGEPEFVEILREIGWNRPFDAGMATLPAASGRGEGRVNEVRATSGKREGGRGKGGRAPNTAMAELFEPTSVIWNKHPRPASRFPLPLGGSYLVNSPLL
jgi:hypothetical protein